MVRCQRCGVPVADPRTMQNGRCIPCDRVATLWELVSSIGVGSVGLVFIALVVWVWTATSFEPKARLVQSADETLASGAAAQ